MFLSVTLPNDGSFSFPFALFLYFSPGLVISGRKRIVMGGILLFFSFPTFGFPFWIAFFFCSLFSRLPSTLARETFSFLSFSWFRIPDSFRPVKNNLTSLDFFFSSSPSIPILLSTVWRIFFFFSFLFLCFFSHDSVLTKTSPSPPPPPGRVRSRLSWRFPFHFHFHFHFFSFRFEMVWGPDTVRMLWMDGWMCMSQERQKNPKGGRNHSQSGSCLKKIKKKETQTGTLTLWLILSIYLFYVGHFFPLLIFMYGLGWRRHSTPIESN